MSRVVVQVRPVSLPVMLVHGGAGDYLSSTSVAQRAERARALSGAARAGAELLGVGDGGAAVQAAVEVLERDPRFNAGIGSRLQADGRCRLSAAIMDGARTRLASVYNIEGCATPSRLAAALLARGDRNLDALGARVLQEELGLPVEDVRTPENVRRWEALIAQGASADPESAVGDAGAAGLEATGRGGTRLPDDLGGGPDDLPPRGRRHGTVGAVAVEAGGGLWACTSTGGRGFESPGRVSDSPTPAGTYACPRVAVSATGFGEQILDLNVAGRIATRVVDGLGLEESLRRTFAEVAAHGGLLGVIAATSDGHVGWAHTTQACGVAWIDGTSAQGYDARSTRDLEESGFSAPG